MAVDKKMQEWIDRQEGYREWNKTHDSYTILYAPDGQDEHGNRIDYKKSIQEKYNELSHPAMGRKQVKEQTLEEQKQELEDSLVQSEYQEKIRIEMDKIRKEGWKEESTTDTHKIIYEAERRVKNGC